MSFLIAMIVGIVLIVLFLKLELGRDRAGVGSRNRGGGLFGRRETGGAGTIMVAGHSLGSGPLLGEDEDFLARWRAAIERRPEAERAMQMQILELCCDIERKVRDCSLLVRDFNVILARTIDRMVRFEATGSPFDAR